MSRHLVFSLILLSIASLCASGQLKTTLNASEPFILGPGRSFSASGGSDTGAANGRLSAIAADVREALDVIRREHVDGRRLDTGELTRSTLSGMLRVLDPHSNYYDPAEWKDLMDEQRSSYSGIGASIANFESSGSNNTYVLAAFPGSPAARMGLKFGDKIVAVNGERVNGLDTDEVRDLIRGETGTLFRLTIERSANGRVETLTMRRGRVDQPSIPDSYMLRPGVGYVDMSEGFNYTTAAEFAAAFADLRKQGMRSMILDLRGNGGGIVDQAVRVAERFLPAGTLILTQRGRSRIDNRTWRSSNISPETMPLVLLVDGDTASASEIVAGAFQDDDRALIVGERTFGKGLVQSVIGLPSGAGLTLTSARYLTPSGRSVQRDYTKLDLYDYYNHKTPAAGADSIYAARTVTDRTVYGGDGIQPDVIVQPSRMTSEQFKLLDPLFLFVREAANGRVDGHRYSASTSAPRRLTPADLPVTNQLIADFNRFAEARAIAPATLARNSAFVKLRLRHMLAMALYGPAVAQQVLIEEDEQVAKAIETLPQAAQLAMRAARVRQSAAR